MKHNFNAGPAILPEYTIQKSIEAIQDFNGSGLSLLCISHRSKDFDKVMDDAIAMTKKLLDIPEGYSVLFVGGGATTQFYNVPFNFFGKKAAYLDTGTWPSGAIREAKIWGEPEVVASSSDKKYNYIPRGYTIPADADYFEICSNNTIEGTEIFEDFDSPAPLISDMSSDIFSRPVDISKYSLIFAGAQKNFAPAGVTMVIIKDSFMEKQVRKVPTLSNYKKLAEKKSMFNTPPVFPIFAGLKTMEWIEAEGGVKEMEKRAIARSTKVYDALEASKFFVPNIPDPRDRSRMNITFSMKPGYEELGADFLSLSKERGCVGLAGHRSVGGFRASCYNALPMESVNTLVALIKEFEAAH